MRISLFRLLFMFFVIPFSINAQSTVKGHIYDSLSVPLSGVNVLLKDSLHESVISYSISNTHGLYELNAIKYRGRCYIEVIALGYEKRSEPIDIENDNDVLTKHFVLYVAPFQLPEVLIEAKQTPIQINQDTTTYNVESFTDGTEEVIEDVIKKLPGLDVSENGSITYKGKAIDKVLIEGDDVFDKNYTVATKNIGSEIVSQIQAIENYQENKILSGLKDSDESVLNIKLKEEVKANYYGNTSLAYGYQERFDASLNLMRLKKKAKYYLLGNTNNIGINPTPYDYFSGLNIQDEEDRKASTLIDIGYFLPESISRKANINETVFVASNMTFKPNEDIRITSNLFFTKDKNLLYKTNSKSIVTPNGDISIDENQNLTRRLKIGELKLGIEYDFSQHSMLTYLVNIIFGQTNTNSFQHTSSGDFSEKLVNDQSIVNQAISYTNRINETSAFVLTSNSFFSKAPQEYLLNPAVNTSLILNGTPGKMDEFSFQESSFSVKGLDFISEYMKSYNSGKYSLKLGYELSNEDLKSQILLKNDTGTVILQEPFMNDNSYDRNRLFFEMVNKYTFKSIKVSSSLSVNYRNIFSDNSDIQNHILYVSPILGVDVNLKGNTSLALAYSFDKGFPGTTHIYPNYVLTNYRTFSRGLPNASVINTHFFLANMTHSNLFNQFSYFTNFIYLNNDKAYSANIFVSNENTITEKILVPGNQNYILNMGMDKFLPFLSSTVKFNANLSWYKYFNFLNKSNIRSNLSFSENYKLMLRSSFDCFFNYIASVEFLRSTFKVKEPPSSTRNDNMKLTFNVIYSPNETFIVNIINEQLYYNLGEDTFNSYNFIDTEVKYTIKKNKLSLKLIGRNLLNNTNFERNTLSDFFVGTERYGFIPRHLLLEVNVRF